MTKFKPVPWQPNEKFDWRTGGRALSREERAHLRKVLRERARDAVERPRMEFDRE